MCSLPHIGKDGKIHVARFGRRDAECGLASAKCTFVCLLLTASAAPIYPFLKLGKRVYTTVGILF